MALYVIEEYSGEMCLASEWDIAYRDCFEASEEEAKIHGEKLKKEIEAMYPDDSDDFTSLEQI